MLHKRTPHTGLLALAAFAVAGLFLLQTGLSVTALAASTANAVGVGVGVDPHAVPVPPPPFKDEDVFPCSECHDVEDEPDTTRRQLEMAHEEIVLEHDQENRWCLDCHDANNRDHLRRASGALIEFARSYELCGQCHGTKYRDWKAGVHGKRTGSWLGAKQYLLCVHCHDPHSPSFKPLEPLAAPMRPEEIR